MVMGECLEMAACRRTQKSSLQFGILVGGHLVPANIHSSDPSELSQWLCHRWQHYKHLPGYFIVCYSLFEPSELHWCIRCAWHRI